jgi:hypothetical protein
MPQYFEIERLMEDLAKSYAAPCASSWFRVVKLDSPSREDFRNKVAEFMYHFEYTLAKFPNSYESEKFKDYTKNLLEKEVKMVLEGNNKEVEKRYNYFVSLR